MKKTFDQPLEDTKRTLAYLLVEVEAGKFIHRSFRDELGLDYFNPLEIEIDKAKDEALQIAKFFYENGLALNSYREVARQVDVNFSLLDDTPGTAEDIICFHAKADRTVDFNKEFKVTTLDKLFADFRGAPDMPSIIKSGIAHIFNERAALHYLTLNTQAD